MSTQELFIQQFTRLFHHGRDSSSPEPEERSASWNSIPAAERHRLVAAARLAIIELETNSQTVEDDTRRFFAKPGEAEWGC